MSIDHRPTYQESSALSGLSDAVGPVEPQSQETRHAAALTVVELARDTADARLLMAALTVVELARDTADARLLMAALGLDKAVS